MKYNNLLSDIIISIRKRSDSLFNLKDIVKAHGVTKVLGYIRKSRQDIEREKRTGEDTLSEQKTLMTGTLDNLETPYELYQEIGSGDSISGRPIFQQAIGELESGKFQAIAVKELSRLSRGNMGDADRVINLLRDNRLLVITPTRIYDIRNTNDHRSIRFELFLAREEYEMIKERMVGARALYSSQGKWMSGATPIGYSYNKKTQRLEINEDEAKTIRLIYDLFMTGLNGQEVSYQAIATHLSNIGIKTAKGKKVWSYTQVKKILTNDLYKGVIKYRTHERNKEGKRIERPKSEHIYVEDAHEPIIEKDYWEKVQDKIKNKLSLPHNPLDFAPNELASVCTCSVCGGKLIRNAQRQKYKRKDDSEVIYYKEFLKCLRGNCMSVKYRDVEDAVLDALKEIRDMDDLDLKEYLLDIVKRKKENSNSQSKEQMLEQIKNKEKEIKDRLNFIYEKYELGIYTDEMFIERKSALDKEQQELKLSMDHLETPELEDEQVSIDKIRTHIKNVLDSYTRLKSKERKNKLLRSTFEEVSVTVTKKGRGRTPAEFYIVPLLRYDLIINP